MWYARGHATSHFCAPAHGRRAAGTGAGPALLDAFVLRRCQILLASARGERAPRIADVPGLDDQTVLDALHAFNAAGLTSLQKKSSRAHRTRLVFGPEQAERLRALLHRSPRDFGKPGQPVDSGVGGRGERGRRDRADAGERGDDPRDAATAGHRLGARQALDHQPRSGICPKKGRRDRLIAVAEQQPDWALGFADETWWSRFAQPQAHSWVETATGPLRLLEQEIPKGDPDPKALACYGVLLRQRGGAERVWLRFVDGRPVSALTEQFLDWCCTRLQEAGVRVWLLIWDNASWHVSKRVRAWMHAHNRQVKQSGQGVRILPCYLPVKSPWLNPIEPKWVHGKRAIVEPARLLSAQELADRVCAHFGCSHDPHLAIPDTAA